MACPAGPGMLAIAGSWKAGGCWRYEDAFALVPGAGTLPGGRVALALPGAAAGPVSFGEKAAVSCRCIIPHVLCIRHPPRACAELAPGLY